MGSKKSSLHFMNSVKKSALARLVRHPTPTKHTARKSFDIYRTSVAIILNFQLPTIRVDNILLLFIYVSFIVFKRWFSKRISKLFKNESKIRKRNLVLRNLNSSHVLIGAFNIAISDNV